MFTQNIDFDAFAATIECDQGDMVDYLTYKFDLSESRGCPPRYGYEQARQIYRGDRILATVYWGSVAGGTHVRHEGDLASLLRQYLVEYYTSRKLDMYPTRIDSRLDLFDEGLFDTMARCLTSYAEENGLKIGQMGDWVRGRERTLYIGSRQSELMVRLYEKGQREKLDPNWIRYEVEFKPKKRDQRVASLDLSAQDILNLRWSGDFLNSVGLSNTGITEYPSVYKKSDDENARYHLVKQYGRIIENWQEEVGGWESLGKELEKAICEH